MQFIALESQPRACGQLDCSWCWNDFSHHATLGAGPPDPTQHRLPDAVQADQSQDGPGDALWRPRICGRRRQGLPALLDDAKSAAGRGRSAASGERLAARRHLFKIPTTLDRLSWYHESKSKFSSKNYLMKLSYEPNCAYHSSELRHVFLFASRETREM